MNLGLLCKKLYKRPQSAGTRPFDRPPIHRSGAKYHPDDRVQFSLDIPFPFERRLAAIEQRYRGRADRERGRPAPPRLGRRSHRFDSVLKAGSPSTMAAYGKTINPGVLLKR